VRRLLITGDAGFIEANFVHCRLQEHPGGRSAVLDALPPERYSHSHPLAARGASSGNLIRYVADLPGHDRRCAISGQMISQSCDFRPAIAVAEGVADTVDWYLYLERPSEHRCFAKLRRAGGP
jgi:dTDP-D-glucose 4,6-dehydratase